MKLLRLLLLILSIAAAALSVYLLTSLTFDGLLPGWLLAHAPGLAILLRWIPTDVRTVGVAAGIAAMFCFGLALPSPRHAPRPEMPAAPAARAASVRAASIRAAPLRIVLALSAGAAVLLLAGDRWLGLNGWLLALVWGVWLALLLALGGALDGRSPRPNPVPGAAPEVSWLWLLLILLLAGFLSLWDAGALPADYPAAAYAAGLQAQTPGLAAGPFAVGSAGLPVAATLLAAAGQAVTRNPFWGGALAGTLAALALVAAVWLLGCELFRRTPAEGPGELPDDGRVPALLAALALAGMMPLVHAARLPWLLEPAVWGTLGLWALLRALRTGRTRDRGAGGGGVRAGGAWLARGLGLCGCRSRACGGLGDCPQAMDRGGVRRHRRSGAVAGSGCAGDHGGGVGVRVGLRSRQPAGSAARRAGRHRCCACGAGAVGRCAAVGGSFDHDRADPGAAAAVGAGRPPVPARSACGVAAAALAGAGGRGGGVPCFAGNRRGLAEPGPGPAGGGAGRRLCAGCAGRGAAGLCGPVDAARRDDFGRGPAGAECAADMGGLPAVGGGNAGQRDASRCAPWLRCRPLRR